MPDVQPIFMPASAFGPQGGWKRLQGITMRWILPGFLLILAACVDTGFNGPARRPRFDPPFVTEEYWDRAVFVAATGASVRVRYPEPRGLSDAPYVENGVRLQQADGFNNIVSNRTPVLPGNEFAVSWAEDIDITFESPVWAVGLWMQDGVALGDLGDCPGRNTSKYDDSEFYFKFFRGNAQVAVTFVDPPIDEAWFYGVALREPIDALQIREQDGDVACEDDFFGRIFTR